MIVARHCLLALASLVCHARSQLAWTPIYLDGSSQVDLWTKTSTGCNCSSEPSRDDCACCVPGGCHCGTAAPHRCVQCGLEHRCANMCNMTIDATRLLAASGKMFGQIKSPAMQGPTSCWYLLRPRQDQRVELQVYRLVGVGRFDGTRSGSLRLVDGAEALPGAPQVEVCGANERYDPPAVLFADRGDATLLFSIGERTARSQFLAYFSFPPKDSGLGTAFQPRGGRRVDGTDCDWLYEEPWCEEPGACVLASPGYPGMYPPRRRCRYFITAPVDMRIYVSFSLLLPHNQCSTDYVAVYSGPSSASPLLTTLCANRKAALTHAGQHMLLEFSSGASMPPYNYNGFMASLQFIAPAAISTEPSIEGGAPVSESGIMMDGMVFPMTTRQPPCKMVLWGNSSRSGHLDSRALPSTSCTLAFVGQPRDTMRVTLLAFRLSPPSCGSVIEIFDGTTVAGEVPMAVICSPDTKQAQDGASRFLQPETYTSSSSAVTVVFKLSQTSVSSGADFLEIAYSFHDEQAASCDTDHRGQAAPSRGHVADPPPGAVLAVTATGQLRCSHRFLPAADQSVVISVTRLGGSGGGGDCHTQCGDGGCRCVSEPRVGSSHSDHVVVVAEGGPVISCLCGDFQQEWLPVSVRSWSPVKVVYHSAAEVAARFSFRADYSFRGGDEACGHHKLLQPSGAIKSRMPATVPALLNHFQYLDCSWLLESSAERQITLEVATNQSRACTAWNISLNVLDDVGGSSGGKWQVLHQFCPRDRYRRYSLPWKVNTVLVRLRALTRLAPEYEVRWRSQAVLANTRVSFAAPGTPPGRSTAPSRRPSWTALVVLVCWSSHAVLFFLRAAAG